jgi:argininosuccinate lyase
LADYLVRKGVAFRDAHHAVGKVVALAEKEGVPLDKLSLEQVRGVNAAFEADWAGVFDLATAMNSRERTGMPGPKQVAAQIACWRGRL